LAGIGRFFAGLAGRKIVSDSGGKEAQEAAIKADAAAKRATEAAEKLEKFEKGADL